ncbi:Hypothetical protein NTJ_05536 [Nesidiocoris tenuis]|uniref:Uncharacterized protein n=1 Tax=Nesidiocoris tenuis TaxID=355587 RepID=A0ABN7AKE3_9HEMI|nr:Hypothetical protein NTJ_05536 [Nesidiocoris tenuis]
MQLHEEDELQNAMILRYEKTDQSANAENILISYDGKGESGDRSALRSFRFSLAHTGFNISHSLRDTHIYQVLPLHFNILAVSLVMHLD